MALTNEDKNLILEELLSALTHYNGGGAPKINKDDLSYEVGILLKLKNSIENDNKQVTDIEANA
jgi:hypothetical protein